MSENENDLQSELISHKKYLSVLEHDLKGSIDAIRIRISQFERKSESNPSMIKVFDEIDQWLIDMEFKIIMNSVLFRSNISLNIQRTDIASILNKAIKHVKYRTGKDIFFNNKIREKHLFWIDAFLFNFVFICLLRYLIDDENGTSQTMAVEISSEKFLSDFKVIKFCLITKNSTEHQNDKFPLQSDKNLFRLETAKRILIAHGGNLQIEKPFQKVFIHLPNSLTQ